MKLLGLVTARGGSKGFPGKNLARLAGRPLVAWSHRALDRLRRRRNDLVIHLSTDSPEIAAAWPARDRPARLRPAELAGDAAASIDVVLYELAQTGCDAVLLLQPTSPLLDDAVLAQLCAALDAGAPAAMAVAEPDHPPRWALAMAADGSLQALHPEAAAGRRQDQARAWVPVGAWIVRADVLRAQRGFLVPGCIGVPVPPLTAVDIDRPCDLDRAADHLAALHPERPFAVGTRRVGGDAPCFIIAEAGVNHDGDPDKAIALVRAAKQAGADAVKFQAFRTDELVTATARTAGYQQAATGDGAQAAMLRRLELGEEHFRRLAAECARLGLAFLCTPFDLGSAQMLRRLGVQAFKLGSGELTNHPLLTAIAGWGLPLIVSTGMSSLDECEDAAIRLRASGDPPCAWLHCVSQYPAPEAQTNLRAMDALRLALGGPVGMSDHSPGSAVTLAAIARGARIIEKHLTLDRHAPGPDHAASIEPDAFAELVRQARLVESALGDGVKRPAPCELDTQAVARRSLVAASDLPAGHRLADGDLAAKRPGGGIAPSELDAALGRVLRHAIARDQALAWDDLA